MTAAKKPKPKPLPKCPLCGRTPWSLRADTGAFFWEVVCTHDSRTHFLRVRSTSRTEAEREWRKLASRGSK